MDWLCKWFDEISEWSPNFSTKERRYWLLISRIPIHAWSRITFQNISNLWGSFICISEETATLNSFEWATMLIATNSPKKINEFINLAIKNQIYCLHVKEFAPDCRMDYQGLVMLATG